jgi:hypothetical protein
LLLLLLPLLFPSPPLLLALHCSKAIGSRSPLFQLALLHRPSLELQQCHLPLLAPQLVLQLLLTVPLSDTTLCLPQGNLVLVEFFWFAFFSQLPPVYTAGRGAAMI